MFGTSVASVAMVAKRTSEIPLWSICWVSPLALIVLVAIFEETVPPEGLPGPPALREVRGSCLPPLRWG